MESMKTTLSASSKVLIVDDEPDIVEEVIERLTKEGLDCIPAYNAAEAMDLVDKRPDIGVVVTDIRMPGMNGIDMARELKENLEEDRDIYVIVVTGHAGMQEAIEALKVGAEDFLTKPVSPDHLIHSVRRAEETIQLRHNEREFHERLEREVVKRTAEARALTKSLDKNNLELIKANRVKDEFLAIISHELRSPLHGIIALAELIQMSQGKDSPETYLEYAEIILKEGNRLSETVDMMLTLSAGNQGLIELNPKPIPVRPLLARVLALTEETIQEKNIALHIDEVPETLIITADEKYMAQALGCLINNAVKFSSRDAEIHICADETPDAWHFILRDNGPGMSEAEIAIAFEPLRQVDGSLSRRHEGCGAGINIATTLTELHGGSLEIDSTPGEGTAVTITLPRNRETGVEA
jgi:signal transduction histidine kinase